MESFFSRLKRKREAKHLTLSDISDATSINVTFLEAIEQGNTTVLPEPYIRAFIKEYARVIGLDPEEALRDYEDTLRPQAAEQKEGPVPAASSDIPPPPAAQEEIPEGGLNPRLAGAAIIVIIIVALIIVLWNLWQPSANEPTGGATPKDSLNIESTPAGATGDEQPLSQQATADQRTLDSLTLTARAIDSVWILVQRDNLTPVDVILKPGGRVSWKARNRFLLTVGNAGGVEILLNGTSFGTLGRRGAVLHDREFNRQSLKRK